MSDKNISKSLKETLATTLAKICYPVADEIGAAFSDKISAWRQNNAQALLEKVNEKLLGNTKVSAQPRIVHHIIEAGSWISEGDLQNMWAGLLQSSCTEDGNDDSNLLFINLLEQLSHSEVKILNYSCENSEKYITTALWVAAEDFEVDLSKLEEISTIQDQHRIDRELDHLRQLGLIVEGFYPESTVANIAPTGLGLQMYVRCKGCLDSPTSYFNLKRKYPYITP